MSPPEVSPPEGPDRPPEPTDRDLLDLMVRSQVEQNRAHARRLEAIVMFHDRRVAEGAELSKAARKGFFQITPLRETQAEVAPLLGTSEQAIAFEVDTTHGLQRWLPRLWARCLAGRLDLGKAIACLDQLSHLRNDEDRAACAAAIQDWFDRHDPPGEDDQGLCRLTRDRIQRAARWQRLKFPKRADSETFAEAYKKRRVSLWVDEECGMASLSGRLAAHDAITADHRLTLIAKKRAQAEGETRNLAQLRADTLVDLIHGRLVVPATTGDVEHHGPCDRTCRVNGDEIAESELTGDDPADSSGGHPPKVAEDQHCPLHPLVLTADGGTPIGGYARPVIQVTVPISTLLGCRDDPGLLSGGIPIPADYARHVASEPGATWYRMLTDDAGGFLALSTNSYQPTDPIWRTVTARDHTCLWPGCRRPAVLVELDHRVPYPEGETSTDNLGPLCRRHHQVKHADGFGMERNADGSYTWTTRHSSTFTTPASEHPLPTWPPSEHVSQERVDELFRALTTPLEKSLIDVILSV